MSEGGALTWREVVDRYHSGLVDELSARLDSDLRDAVSRAVAEARRSQVESLNQVLRRLRTAGEEHILKLVAEGCAPFAGQLVVLVFESNQARSAAASGLSSTSLVFDTTFAPAIVAAIESRDPVVALATAGEISSVLADALEMTPGAAEAAKAYLFPVVARHTVVAMLVASEIAASAEVELLCEAAGMRLEALASAPWEQTGTADAARAASRTSWDNLTAGDQKLHLQAQRMARLRVAEMRLYHEKELKSGVAAQDIYGALQPRIDAARKEFLDAFLSKSPTMVDYLHLEILRSLAHDDDRLLGRSYPGPMV
jgi:hypothetical protein